MKTVISSWSGSLKLWYAIILSIVLWLGMGIYLNYAIVTALMFYVIYDLVMLACWVSTAIEDDDEISPHMYYFGASISVTVLYLLGLTIIQIYKLANKHL